jgi:hypothetical protein
MKIRVKQTGVEMEVPDGSVAAKRVREQPDDYVILDEIEEVKSEFVPKKGGK